MNQPELPPLDDDWPEETVQWWARWGKDPLTQHCTATDWSFLFDTALTHMLVWGASDFTKLGELRIREAEFRTRMAARAEPVAAPTGGEGTVLDEVAKRRKERQAGAPAGTSAEKAN